MLCDRLSWPSHQLLSARKSTVSYRICRLGLAMFNPHIKFEMYTITCNEEMNGNDKCKNSRFEPPFGELRGNAQGSSMDRWKARCRLPISDNWTCHGCITIKRNMSKSAFSDGGGSL